MTIQRFPVLAAAALCLALPLFFASMPVSALDSDPEVIAAADRKPIVMTVFGLRSAVPVSDSAIRVEFGTAVNKSVLGNLNTYRIVSPDDPAFAYADFVRPLDVKPPSGGSEFIEAIAPDNFTPSAGAANISKFTRYSYDLILSQPMKDGCTYAVVAHGIGSDMASAAKTGTQFVYKKTSVQPVNSARPADLQTLSVLGLRGLDSVGNGIIRLEFGPTFSKQAGYLAQNYNISINGKPVKIKGFGRRSVIDLYLPVGWPFSVLLQHEIFLQLDTVLSEGDLLRVETAPGVVSGANAAAIKFSTKSSLASSIKVNQIGYIASSKIKRACLGRWLGSFPDEDAVLNVSDDTQYRDISSSEVFFGESKAAMDDIIQSAAQKTKDAKPNSDPNAKPKLITHFSKSAMAFDEPPPFEIRDSATHQTVFSGKSILGHPGKVSEGRAQFSGENVYYLDFPDFSTPGRYYIAIPGVGRSFDFSIADNVFTAAFDTAAYGVFAQRCGIELAPPYSEWRRIACHNHGIQLTTQSKIKNPGLIDPKYALFITNPDPDVQAPPAIYSDPALIAHFPFDGSAANTVSGGMTLSPLSPSPDFKKQDNLFWSKGGNRVYYTHSGAPNGWSGNLKYDTDKGLSLGFWMRRTDAPKGNKYDGKALSLTNGTLGNLAISFVWGVMRFHVGKSAIFSPGRVGDDKWHFYAMTVTPGSTAGKTPSWLVNIYIDGARVKTVSAEFKPGNNFTFGCLANEGAEGASFDELRIFNRVLSQSEIQSLAKRVEASVPNRISAFGGHHDAGDYNPRSHLDVAQILMDAYEAAPRKFYDGQLNIPEKDNGIPDILDEALWALKLWIGLQDADGGVRNGTESDGDPNFIQTVELDPKGDFAYAKDAQGSLLFAGAMAQASRLLRSVGKTTLADDYLKRAEQAYRWAKENKPQTNSAASFGNFYTVPLAYASAQLYHSTWNDAYHQDFLQNTPWQKNANAKMIASGGEYDLTLAAYAYAAIPRAKALPFIHSSVIRAICEEADKYVVAANAAAYKFVRHPFAPINWGTGAYEHFLTVVWHAWAYSDNLLRIPVYHDAIIRTADNTLGCNPMNISWIVHLGTKTVRAPLHNSRFNPTGFSVRGMQVQGPVAEGREYNFTSTVFPKRSSSSALLYTFTDSIFAIGMDEGTVRNQAETMAAFGLLLPDQPAPEKPKTK